MIACAVAMMRMLYVMDLCCCCKLFWLIGWCMFLLSDRLVTCTLTHTIADRWVHPAVFILTAAFDTLEHERQAQAEPGLFSSLTRLARQTLSSITPALKM